MQKTLIIIAVLFIVSVAPLAYAQTAGGFAPLADFSNSSKLTDAYQTGDLATFLNKLFVGAISIGAILAVLRLSWAGYLYMGSDLWSDKSHARDVIKETLLGLFLLLGIWLILNQINPDILTLKVNATPAPSAAPSQQSSSPSVFNGGVPAGTQNVNGVGVDQNGVPLSP